MCQSSGCIYRSQDARVGVSTVLSQKILEALRVELKHTYYNASDSVLKRFCDSTAGGAAQVYLIEPYVKLW
jgi:hypothetical protein